MKLKNIEYLIIHHTGTSKDYTTFEAVRKYHILKGWGEIGYHYFIDGEGKVFIGRREDEVGAHCKASGMNFKSLGICLAGNFEKEHPGTVQFLKLSEILNCLVNKYLILPDKILGHCEVPGAKTLCPGRNLLYWIDIYRRSFPKKKLILIKIKLLLNQISKLLKKFSTA